MKGFCRVLRGRSADTIDGLEAETIKQVEIFTDGACSGNPGAGGWGAVLRFGEHEKELSGGQAQTTNNRMELTAVIEALSALKEPCSVTLTTDSKYVSDAVSKGWVYGWQKKNWMRAPENQPKTPTCGSCCSLCSDATRSHSTGSRDMPVIRKTNAATLWLSRPLRVLGEKRNILRFPLANNTKKVYN